jgi:NADPH:quinone reductase-like Zn-dependent oxidoreductase
MRVFEVPAGASSIDALRAGERARPVPGPHEALVRIRAAALNFRDLAVVSGKYIGGPVTRDLVPLSDGAGEVEAVGAEVTRFAVGDRVVAHFSQGRGRLPLGSPLDGMLREYAVFDEDGLLAVPAHLDFEAAATLPCTGVTAWNALFEGKPLKPGETVLTLGTGGVSVFALQLARLAGARVIITSSSDEKLEMARALGADALINYLETPQWAQRVLELTDGRGVDHLVETAAPATLPQSYQAIGPEGEIALIGVLTRPEGNLNPQPMMLKGATMRGIFVGEQAHFERLNRAVGLHHLRPVVSRVFDFDEAPEAYRYLKSAAHFGKVVIRIA